MVANCAQEVGGEWLFLPNDSHLLSGIVPKGSGPLVSGKWWEVRGGNGIAAEVTPVEREAAAGALAL